MSNAAESKSGRFRLRQVLVDMGLMQISLGMRPSQVDGGKDQ